MGRKGEADAAYQIEFYAASNPNVMTLHDLRMQCDGRVAQIDHLIITRLFEFWVCESKRFAEGVEINEHGEWAAYYDGRRRGIPSPIEQNRRHITVLKDVFAKRLIATPRRLGPTPTPTFLSLVLVSDHARITRPTGAAAARVEGLDSVIKADQLKAKINTSNKEWIASQGTSATVVDRETIKNVARQLAALHSPGSIDWQKRFGLSPRSPDAHRISPPSGHLGHVRFADRPAARSRLRAIPSCDSCGDTLTPGVVEYCLENAGLFRGRVLCMPCQDYLYPDRY